MSVSRSKINIANFSDDHYSEKLFVGSIRPGAKDGEEIVVVMHETLLAYRVMPIIVVCRCLITLLHQKDGGKRVIAGKYGKHSSTFHIIYSNYIVFDNC